MKNSKDMGKQDASNEGYPVYMDSKYCEKFLEDHENCEPCEYSFACDKVLEMTLKHSIKIVRNVLIEEGDIKGKINSEDCKEYRIINNSCKNCSHNDECYIEALKFFKELKGLNNETEI